MSAQLTHEGTQARTTERAARPATGGSGECGTGSAATVQEMNYASRRVVELQAPWSVDEQWHSR